VGDILKRLVIISILIVYLLVLFLNYTDIAAYTVSIFQYKKEVTVFYEEETEPKDKLADISIAALDSVVSARFTDKQYRFVSLDAEKIGDFSDDEVQYLLTYFKKYSDKVFCATMKELSRIGLCTPQKDLRGGILLSINEVIELTNESAVLEVSYHLAGLGAGGYICKLKYENGRWEVTELEPKYIA
jgi:hypothetical protein